MAYLTSDMIRALSHLNKLHSSTTLCRSFHMESQKPLKNRLQFTLSWNESWGSEKVVYKLIARSRKTDLAVLELLIIKSLRLLVFIHLKFIILNLFVGISNKHCHITSLLKLRSSYFTQLLDGLSCSSVLNNRT